MSLEDLRAKMKKLEEPPAPNPDAFKKKGFVKEEEAETTVAETPNLAHAPAFPGPLADGDLVNDVKDLVRGSNTMKRVQRLARKLCERMTEGDRERNVRILREAGEAVVDVYHPGTKTMFTRPDHKMRMASALAFLAYDEGTPVARSVQVTADMSGLDDALQRIQGSPEAAAVLVRQLSEILGPLPAKVVEEAKTD